MAQPSGVHSREADDPMKLHSEAVALFGSVCRKTTDHLSDRDILLVDDSERTTRRDAALLKSRGWSVARYNWRRLETLHRHQALFVQHLKLESFVIHDKANKLRSLLESFRPSVDYFQDISNGENIIALVERTPDSVQGIGWAFDVLAVGIRILGIGYLANEGRYVFGFNEILDELVNIDRLSFHDRDVLSILRKSKAAYRKRDWISALVASP